MCEVSSRAGVTFHMEEQLLGSSVHGVARLLLNTPV